MGFIQRDTLLFLGLYIVFALMLVRKKRSAPVRWGRFAAGIVMPALADFVLDAGVLFLAGSEAVSRENEWIAAACPIAAWIIMCAVHLAACMLIARACCEDMKKVPLSVRIGAVLFAAAGGLFCIYEQWYVQTVISQMQESLENGTFSYQDPMLNTPFVMISNMELILKGIFVVWLMAGVMRAQRKQRLF